MLSFETPCGWFRVRILKRNECFSLCIKMPIAMVGVMQYAIAFNCREILRRPLEKEDVGYRPYGRSDQE